MPDQASLIRESTTRLGKIREAVQKTASQVAEEERAKKQLQALLERARTGKSQ